MITFKRYAPYADLSGYKLAANENTRFFNLGEALGGDLQKTSLISAGSVRANKGVAINSAY